MRACVLPQLQFKSGRRTKIIRQKRETTRRVVQGKSYHLKSGNKLGARSEEPRTKTEIMDGLSASAAKSSGGMIELGTIHCRKVRYGHTKKMKKNEVARSPRAATFPFFVHAKPATRLLRWAGARAGSSSFVSSRCFADWRQSCECEEEEVLLLGQ